jgi:hypothetical protein
MAHSQTQIQERQTDVKVKTAGLLAGSAVLTMAGEKMVEELKAGDKIITRRGARVLKAAISETVTMRPIKLGVGTLGNSRPSSPLRIAPGQKVLVRDWRAQMLFGEDAVIIPVARLVDGTHIAQADTKAEHMTYSLQFDEQEIFYADGVEIVSAKA